MSDVQSFIDESIHLPVYEWARVNTIYEEPYVLPVMIIYELTKPIFEGIVLLFESIYNVNYCEIFKNIVYLFFSPIAGLFMAIISVASKENQYGRYCSQVTYLSKKILRSNFIEPVKISVSDNHFYYVYQDNYNLEEQEVQQLENSILDKHNELKCKIKKSKSTKDYRNTVIEFFNIFFHNPRIVCKLLFNGLNQRDKDRLLHHFDVFQRGLFFELYKNYLRNFNSLGYVKDYFFSYKLILNRDLLLNEKILTIEFFASVGKIVIEKFFNNWIHGAEAIHGAQVIINNWKETLPEYSVINVIKSLPDEIDRLKLMLQSLFEIKDNGEKIFQKFYIESGKDLDHPTNYASAMRASNHSLNMQLISGRKECDEKILKKLKESVELQKKANPILNTAFSVNEIVYAILQNIEISSLSMNLEFLSDSLNSKSLEKVKDFKKLFMFVKIPNNLKKQIKEILLYKMVCQRWNNAFRLTEESLVNQLFSVL